MDRIFLLVSSLLLAFLLTGARAAGHPKWFVTSRHPEDLKKLWKFAEPVDDRGRILVVKAKPGVTAFPPDVRAMLSPVKPGEVLQYIPGALLLTESAVNPRIQGVIDQVDPAQIRGVIETLVEVQNRSGGTSENQAMTRWVESKLKSFGYATRLQCFTTGVKEQCNVIAERRAAAQSASMVVVMAHLDSVGKSYAGADDNGSGVGGLVEMARVLATSPIQKNLQFVVTNGEERGLLGSKAYVQALKAENLASHVSFSVNMDMIGYNSDKIVDLETNREFEPLAKWAAEKARQYTKLTPNITMPAWGSDHVPMLGAGVPTLLTIEHWQTKTPCYHQACDTLNTLNLSYAAEIVRLNVAMVLEKAGGA